MKKITFKNEPSVETPISAENLNLMQANAEEEINRIDTVSTENTKKIQENTKNITNLINNKILVEEYTDNEKVTRPAGKWSTYQCSFKKTFGNDNICDYTPDVFTIKKSGLYNISFLSSISYQEITGIYFYVNGKIIENYNALGGGKVLKYNKLYNLKENDKVTVQAYTDKDGINITHYFSRIIFTKLGEYIPPVQA